MGALSCRHAHTDSPGVASRLPHFLHDQVESFVLEGGGKIKEGEGERPGLIGVLCMTSAFFI